MAEATFFDSSAPFSAPKKKRSRKWLVFLFLILLTILLGVGLYHFLKTKPGLLKQAIPLPTPTVSVRLSPTLTPIASPSAAPKPTIDRSSVSVTIENGSGVAGAAGSMASALKTLRYNVVATTNAGSFTYQGVTIEVKKGQDSLLALLKQDLSKTYTITNATTTLPDSSASDAVVIVGK